MNVAIEPRNPIPAGNIHVQRMGAGHPLLWIHGFPLNSRMWVNQFELADHFELIVPDLRGFGRSSPLIDGWQVDDFAKDLDSLLDQLDLPSVVVGGLSLGGYVAFEFWNHFPERVTGLVLCNTRAEADDQTTARARQWMAERVLRQGADFVEETMVPKLLNPSNQGKTLSPAVGSFFAEVDPSSIALTQLAMSQRNDFSARLGEIQCPTLVIAGQGDLISPAGEMAEMAKAIADSRFITLPDAGHLTPIENPTEFNRCVRDNKEFLCGR